MLPCPLPYVNVSNELCVLYSPQMKYIKPFVYLTTAVSIIGGLGLLNDGSFDVYALWNICALLSASYYMSKR